MMADEPPLPDLVELGRRSIEAVDSGDLDGVRAWLGDFLDSITEMTVTVDEWIDGGNEAPP